MTKLIIIVGIVVFLVIIFELLKGQFEDDVEKQNPKYQYKRRQFFLTRAEHECYDALVAAVGNEYFIFAQVHLPTLLDNKVVGQDWRAALTHINRKSVDFVLCDRNFISPKLAIELDDKSHEGSERQKRDQEVERILQNTGIPLLRLENHGRFNVNELTQNIKDTISVSRSETE